MVASSMRRAPFIGRTRELAELARRLELAGQGHGGVVLVAGEPGVGKTRLVLEFADHAKSEGWTILIGHAYELDGMPPYALFAEALRGYGRTHPAEELRAQLGDHMAEVALIAPDVRQYLPGISAGPALSPELERLRLFEGVCDFLAAIAHAAPAGLLLILDDLQWADGPSLLLLQHLARRLASLPLLVAGTYRTVALNPSDGLATVLASFRHDGVAERLSLTSLPRSEAVALVEALWGEPPAPGVAEALYRATEGHPFYLEELVRYLAGEGRDLTDPTAAAGDWSAPEGVREALSIRLSRLSAEANRLLQIASVLGDGFDFDVLRELAGFESGTLLDALDEARAAGFLQEDGVRYRFSHALIRQTIEEQLSSPRRRDLHQRAAEAMERLYARNLEPYLGAIAVHYRKAGAGAAARALEFARRAGEAAAAVYAWEESADYWQAAVEVLQPSDQLLRAEMQLAIGQARNRAGAPTAARDQFRQVAEIARALSLPQVLARAALGYAAEWAPTHVVDEEVVTLLEEALTALGEDDSTLRVRVLARLATELRYGRAAAAESRRAGLSSEAVEMARRTGDPGALADALISRRIALWNPDNLDERLALDTDVVRLTEAAGDGERMLQGFRFRLVDLLELGDIEAVDREIDAYHRVAKSLRLPRADCRSFLWWAMRAQLEGRFADAERLAQQALDAAETVQSPDIARHVQVQRLTLQREQGRLAEQELKAVRKMDGLLRVLHTIVERPWRCEEMARRETKWYPQGRRGRANVRGA